MNDERTDRRPDAEVDVEQAAASDETAPTQPGPQLGGSRGSSNQGGPERSGEPEKDQAVKVGGRHDLGSRSSLGRPEPIAEPSPEDALRGPLPAGASPEDYLGGQKPHKTRTRRRTRGASGVKNEVV